MDEDTLVIDHNALAATKGRIGLLSAIRRMATPANCTALAELIWQHAMDGDHRYVEILLDRLEGKVTQSIVMDTVINVIHHIPPRVESGAAPLAPSTERSPVLISDHFEDLT